MHQCSKTLTGDCRQSLQSKEEKLFLAMSDHVYFLIYIWRSCDTWQDLEIKISLEKSHWKHEGQVIDFSLFSKKQKLTIDRIYTRSLLCFLSKLECQTETKFLATDNYLLLLTAAHFYPTEVMWVHYLYIFCIWYLCSACFSIKEWGNHLIILPRAFHLNFHCIW